MRRALIIGNSDGIGLAITTKLLADGWTVFGISRRECPIKATQYTHLVCDVSTDAFSDALRRIAHSESMFDVCLYCAGIGQEVNPERLGLDVNVFKVNLLGAVAAAEILIPLFVAAGKGRFVVLSSLADRLISAEFPSYCASKAAVSSYFEGLGLALRTKGVVVTNIRFGFVDTKMAKAPVKPFIISKEKAADVVIASLDSSAIRVSYPRRMALLAGLGGFVTRIRVGLLRAEVGPRL